MSNHHPIDRLGSRDLFHSIKGRVGAREAQIMCTPMLFAEPFPYATPTYESSHADVLKSGVLLTIEQRMQLDMFLAPFQTWTVITAAPDTSWRITSGFAPRLHSNGEIDFVAPYPAASHALGLITANPLVSFLIGDGAAERRVEGWAQAVVIQRPWERAELLAYLQWRTPGITECYDGAIQVVEFRPTYLRYSGCWSI
jgi:hypothetical protein